MKNDMVYILPYYDEKVSQMIIDEELEMWEFSPFSIFDKWEAEQVTGNPRNSFYLRGD